MREVQLPNAAWGKIYLHSMPGLWEEDLDTFAQDWAKRHVECIVCLAPRHEIEKMSPKYHEAIVSGSLPVPVLEFGIPDFGIPEDADSFASLVQRIEDDVDKPSRILDQLKWLEEAGFQRVDVYWMYAGHAIFGGEKPA